MKRPGVKPGGTHSSGVEIRGTVLALENPAGQRLLGRSGRGNGSRECRSESEECHELHCGRGGSSLLRKLKSCSLEGVLDGRMLKIETREQVQTPTYIRKKSALSDCPRLVLSMVVDTRTRMPAPGL